MLLTQLANYVVMRVYLCYVPSRSCDVTMYVYIYHSSVGVVMSPCVYIYDYSVGVVMSPCVCVYI